MRTSRSNRLPTLPTLLCWAALAVAPAAAQAPELTRLRALLVVDTRSGLGESVLLDGQRMTALLRSGVPPARLELTIFNKPGQLTRDSILR